MRTYLTFIGGGLATAATLYGALLTKSHNRLEHRRLQLNAVLASLQSLPEGDVKARLSGVLPTMVLLGQQRVALRALDPIVESKSANMDSVAWVIDQIMNGDQLLDLVDGDRSDPGIVNETASLLCKYAEQGRLTRKEPQDVWFPTYFYPGGHWNRALPAYAKELTLRATAHTLLSQEPDWWSKHAGGELPDFPTKTWTECAKRDFDRKTQSEAVALLDALLNRFPESERKDVDLAPTASLTSQPRDKIDLRINAKKIIAKRKRDLSPVSDAIYKLAAEIRGADRIDGRPGRWPKHDRRGDGRNHVAQIRFIAWRDNHYSWQSLPGLIRAAFRYVEVEDHGNESGGS
ncbi:hypothetical protein Daura_36415 [Dactylosporangium aurantiacum]|uniref:Uncharacterized protein n=1 Tax=Dactylosporangium aurantiacum TaxID=35754 RepID=A0A9Q9MJQ7_9ACTN|nr:hypothetical protein [Dactylosporangium aurantiacum]MDG6103339.1 hypothetical protein [Dactylosporangium aurantiacum]UWZ52137.1 hypothetical protein Daura_36415 [Dactylosporangium aurantiacum]